MDQVRIEIPSSSANVGLGYDIWCLGLEEPRLGLTYTRIPEADKSSFIGDIDVEAKSGCIPPHGRELGYAGKKALKAFLSRHGIREGAHLLYEDTEYPVGGLGRSGAEAVGAIVAAALIYDKRLGRDDIVFASGEGEPGHLDNVAASTNGRFNIISTSPATGDPRVDFLDVPENLGIAIGYSSHQKTRGTEAYRAVLRDPVDSEDFVRQIGMVSAATAALSRGNTDRFLELAWGDRYHEPRRADAECYGKFTAEDFNRLKSQLFGQFNIALNVSGAGPNMQFLYNIDEHANAAEEISPFVVPWFEERGVSLRIENKKIAREGAYDYTQNFYDWNSSQSYGD